MLTDVANPTPEERSDVGKLSGGSEAVRLQTADIIKVKPINVIIIRVDPLGDRLSKSKETLRKIKDPFKNALVDNLIVKKMPRKEPIKSTKFNNRSVPKFPCSPKAFNIDGRKV